MSRQTRAQVAPLFDCLDTLADQADAGETIMMCGTTDSELLNLDTSPFTVYKGRGNLSVATNCGEAAKHLNA